MWTVVGKSLFSILFLAIIDLAFSANPPYLNFTFAQTQQQNKCIWNFLKFFDDLNKNDLISNRIFQRRFESARNSLSDSYCSSKLSTIRRAVDFMRFIWREQTELVCQFRAQNTTLSDEQIKAMCETSPSHDLIALENKDHNVIMVGETHKKDYISGKKAENLLKHFPYRGIEGFSGSIEFRLGDGFISTILAAFTQMGVLSDSTTYKSLETGYYFGFDGEKDFLMFNQVKATNLASRRADPFHFLEKLESDPTYPVTINLERSPAVRERIERDCQSLNSCSGTKRTQLLIYLRNYDMANSITKILDVLPKNKDLLVIVGNRHVSDLANRVSCQNKMTWRVLSGNHQDHPGEKNFDACQQIAKIDKMVDEI
ncbi:MAG: hypothetical protein A4S09_16670 [Proteobacteria bacterium SG_bin7]|nr:MAG: hypothetical protein A4S09_16670 [Proteobacteria bacterium SG_bin7]